MSKQWCILRCAGQNTLPLMRSLTKAGFEVWSPVEVRTKRVPRANVKRTIEFAMLPSYLFAAADRVVDLIALSNAPGREHRDFRVFQRQDRAPLIADSDLADLRLAERKVTAKAERPHFEPGETVRLEDGGFAGLTGEVVSARGEFVSVQLPGFRMAIKVRSFYLLREHERSATMRAA